MSSNRFIGTLRSGERVYDRHRSHVSECVVPYLKPALSQITSTEENFFTKEVLFSSTIGKCVCIPTTKNDAIVWAKRPKRHGYTRFVKNRLPELSNALTVILMKAQGEDYYILITAFIGGKAEPEPWDRNATPESFPFWNSHALVWDPASIIPGTETTVCPW